MSEQKSDREKAEIDAIGKWNDKAFMHSNQGSYLIAIKHFKSSLKRDIEKEEALWGKGYKTWTSKELLELIETVEP